MARSPYALREALQQIAQGRSDAVGATTVGGAFFQCVRLAREALGICTGCREQLKGNRSRECERLHPSACCYCAGCSESAES